MNQVILDLSSELERERASIEVVKLTMGVATGRRHLRTLRCSFNASLNKDKCPSAVPSPTDHLITSFKFASRTLVLSTSQAHVMGCIAANYLVALCVERGIDLPSNFLQQGYLKTLL